MAGSLEGNKIFAAILTAGIIGVGSGVLSGILYHPHELEEPVYKVEVAAAEGAKEGGGEQAAAESKPIGELLASASVEKGEAYAKKCAACHSFEKGGPNKVGPNLYGVVGRPIASHEGFSYSDALAALEGVWTPDELNAFITNPKEHVPGTKMAFAGVKSGEERANLVAYLQSTN